MTPHLRYLRYVLLHKLAVFQAGWAMRRTVSAHPVRWFWRLLVHDWSKLSRAEWSPYVAMFYGPPPTCECDTGGGHGLDCPIPEAKRTRKAAFDRAWLHHIHANPHHWQYHILHEDSGKVLVLIPEASYVDEMVADWLGAGPKARLMPMQERVAMTIVWYAENVARMQMREIVKRRVEEWLMQLAVEYGVRDAAQEIASLVRARQSIVIPGR